MGVCSDPETGVPYAPNAALKYLYVLGVVGVVWFLYASETIGHRKSIDTILHPPTWLFVTGAQVHRNSGQGSRTQGSSPPNGG